MAPSTAGQAQAIIPDIPGQVVPDEIANFLKEHVSQLTGSGSRERFPGSQPVSFNSRSIGLLETKNFWVCEKSDGVRVLGLIAWNAALGQQDVFLLDRKNTYRQVTGLSFPHHDPRQGFCKSTIFDGELVVDTDRRTGRTTLRLYAFDCLVYDGVSLMASSLQSRYGRLKSWLIEPFHRALAKNPQLQSSQPFEIVCKNMQLADAVALVVNDLIPRLEHGHDGLIFTCAETGYVMGTDEMIIKWKPPAENTIDFKLQLRFPPLRASDAPDLEAKPEFLLYAWMGDNRQRDGDEQFYDRMVVLDEEWEEMKASHEQYDDRVIECWWDEERDSFRFMRFRDDKHNGNHISVVKKIIESIRDGVQLETLLEACPNIRARRKEREALAKASRPPLTSQPSASAPQAPIPPGWSQATYASHQQPGMTTAQAPMLRR